MIRAWRRDLDLYLRLLRRARSYAPSIATLFALGLLATPVALLTPLPIKIVVDSVLGDRPLPDFLAASLPAAWIDSPVGLMLLAVGLLLGVALTSRLLDLSSGFLRTWTGEKLVLEFRSELFRCVQRLSFSTSETRNSADSLYRIQNDAPAIQYVAIDGVIPFVAAAVTIAGMLYVSARIDAQLALVALTVAPALFVTLALYRSRLRARARRVKRLESSALGVVHEVLGALRVVQAFGQEEREHERFAHRAGAGLRARLSLTLVEGLFALLVGLITASGTAAVLWIGATHVRAGILSLGDLLLVMGYLAQLYDPLKTMSRKAARMQAHLESAERAFALLDETPDVVERPNARPLVRTSGAVSFRNVSFAYGSGRTVLHEISFQVPPGARVGVTGRTGAGKTTLIGLLARFHDPMEGCVLLDGVDLRDYRLADLRRQFAIVLQEPVLFSTSLAENIAYGRPGANDSEIVAAARAAGAHDFIERTPEGYESRVGERGMRLSGGERQRIALARAFLKDAPILLLDEPTSSVDAATEHTILEAMDRLAQGRTTFTIAHRWETLEGCDLHVEIDQGRVAFAGAPGSAPPEPVAARIAR